MGRASEVCFQASLSPFNGLPVRSALSAGKPLTSSNNIVDVDVNDEILWWTAGTRTGIGTVSVNTNYSNTVSLPLNIPINLFPGGIGVGSNGNPAGYVAAHLYGTFFAPSDGDITLNLGADDDAWVFSNDQLVVDLGGVKALTPAPTTVAGLIGGPELHHRPVLRRSARCAVGLGVQCRRELQGGP